MSQANALTGAWEGCQTPGYDTCMNCRHSNGALLLMLIGSLEELAHARRASNAVISFNNRYAAPVLETGCHKCSMGDDFLPIKTQDFDECVSP